jgi:hypothetical protein
MTRYIFFLTKDLQGNICEGCGSDYYWNYDQRWGLNRAVEEAIHKCSLDFFKKKGFIGFEIRSGSSILNANNVIIRRILVEEQ